MFSYVFWWILARLGHLRFSSLSVVLSAGSGCMSFVAPNGGLSIVSYDIYD